MTILIADIGNNHFGDYELAKELIHQAIDSGADIIKGQAFREFDMNGSMPRAFYQKCELTKSQILNLISYSRLNEREMFFSIFSDGFGDVAKKQKYRKFAGGQTRKMTNSEIEQYDKANYFISMERRQSFPELKNACALYVTDYLAENANLEYLKTFSNLYKRFGYSDHTINNDNPISAVLDYGAQVVEVHFTLKKNLSFASQVFRDTIFGKTPNELYQIARRIKQ